MALYTIYASTISIFWLFTVFYLVQGRRRVRFLSKVKTSDFYFPVAIVIPVRNEAQKLREALTSILRLNYSRLRIIALDDRSTDNTHGILEDLAKNYPNLTVVKINQLPAGWLGKNHALYTGFQLSTEEWILFTDADVHFKPDTLIKAIAYASENSLDHLTVMPRVTSPSPMLNALLGTFVMMLELKHKPWLVSDTHSNVSLGVGAFNLVRRRAYERAGTHLTIALRPDDDLKLGEIIKKSDGRSDALYGDEQISVEWYPSVAAFVDGLMKNTFSIFNYQWWRAVLMGIFPVLLVFVLPFLLPFTGRVGLVAYLIILASHFILFKTNRGIQTAWWHFVTIPLAGIIMSFIIVKSTLVTMLNGGIYWRDTFYPLDDLRKDRH